MSEPPRPPPIRLSAARSLVAAWRTLKADPVGILLPSAGILLVELGALLALRLAYGEVGLPWEDTVGWERLLWLAVALRVVVFAVATPLRAVLIATGARALGLEVRPFLRIPALFVVEGVIAVLQALAWGVVAAPGVVFAGMLVGHRALTVGAVALAAALVLAAFAGFAVRVLLAYAPYEVILGGRGPIAALRRGWQLARGGRLSLAVVLLVGDTLTALGGLVCGAGALPGYPIGPLAVLHRWITTREVP